MKAINTFTGRQNYFIWLPLWKLCKIDFWADFLVSTYIFNNTDCFSYSVVFYIFQNLTRIHVYYFESLYYLIINRHHVFIKNLTWKLTGLWYCSNAEWFRLRILLVELAHKNDFHQWNLTLSDVQYESRIVLCVIN